LQLMILESTPDTVRAGYECPCGCRPSVAYAPHDDAAYDACCCGNEFAVGHEGTTRLAGREPFRREAYAFTAPWGEPLEAVWLIGSSTQAGEPPHDHDHDHHPMRPVAMAHSPAHDASRGAVPEMALDPVCGMTVDPESARAKGLHSEYKGREYFFCGKGCKLDFDEDPARYLDPTYTPSM